MLSILFFEVQYKVYCYQWTMVNASQPLGCIDHCLLVAFFFRLFEEMRERMRLASMPGLVAPCPDDWTPRNAKGAAAHFQPPSDC